MWIGDVASGEMCFSLISCGPPLQARFGGGRTWYTAVVTKLLGSGNYTLSYDSGETENDVAENFLAPLKKPSTSAVAKSGSKPVRAVTSAGTTATPMHKYKVGEKIWVRYVLVVNIHVEAAIDCFSIHIVLVLLWLNMASFNFLDTGSISRRA